MSGRARLRKIWKGHSKNDERWSRRRRKQIGKADKEERTIGVSKGRTNPYVRSDEFPGVGKSKSSRLPLFQDSTSL